MTYHISNVRSSWNITDCIQTCIIAHDLSTTVADWKRNGNLKGSSHSRFLSSLKAFVFVHLLTVHFWNSIPSEWRNKWSSIRAGTKDHQSHKGMHRSRDESCTKRTDGRNTRRYEEQTTWNDAIAVSTFFFIRLVYRLIAEGVMCCSEGNTLNRGII